MTPGGNVVCGACNVFHWGFIGTGPLQDGASAARAACGEAVLGRIP
jgi:hypothetical protein